MIRIKKEPAEYYLQFKAYEKCYFCNQYTDTWNMKTNTPVCLGCSKVHSVAELPIGFNSPIVGEEVTLGELLPLAAEAQNTGLNSFETMVEEKMSNLQSCIEKAKTNGWQKDGRDADEQVRELRGNGIAEIVEQGNSFVIKNEGIYLR